MENKTSTDTTDAANNLWIYFHCNLKKCRQRRDQQWIPMSRSLQGSQCFISEAGSIWELVLLVCSPRGFPTSLITIRSAPQRSDQNWSTGLLYNLPWTRRVWHVQWYDSVQPSWDTLLDGPSQEIIRGLVAQDIVLPLHCLSLPKSSMTIQNSSCNWLSW